MLASEVSLENGTHTVYSVTVSELNDCGSVNLLDIQGTVIPPFMKYYILYK